MRFEVEAVRDIEAVNYSDRTFNHKKGEKIELSSAGVEMVLSKDFESRFGKSFELVREIPETDMEKERAKKAEEVEKTTAELSATPKEKLVKKAEKAGIQGAKSLRKEPLVEAMVAEKFGEQPGTATNIADAPTTQTVSGTDAAITGAVTTGQSNITGVK